MLYTDVINEVEGNIEFQILHLTGMRERRQLLKMTKLYYFNNNVSSSICPQISIKVNNVNYILNILASWNILYMLVGFLIDDDRRCMEEIRI